MPHRVAGRSRLLRNLDPSPRESEVLTLALLPDPRSAPPAPRACPAAPGGRTPHPPSELAGRVVAVRGTRALRGDVRLRAGGQGRASAGVPGDSLRELRGRAVYPAREPAAGGRHFGGPAPPAHGRGPRPGPLAPLGLAGTRRGADRPGPGGGLSLPGRPAPRPTGARRRGPAR